MIQHLFFAVFEVFVVQNAKNNQPHLSAFCEASDATRHGVIGAPARFFARHRSYVQRPAEILRHVVAVAQMGFFSSTLASMEISGMVHIVRNASSMHTAPIIKTNLRLDSMAVRIAATV
jgi:hypothetical protein